MFDLSLFGVFTVWISVETLLLVFDVLLFCVWISDGTLLLVFDIVSIFRHQTKHSFSLVIPNKTPHLVFTTVQHTLICFFRLLLKSLTLKL